MERKYVQPLRNKQIYKSKDLAIDGLIELCNGIGEFKPKDGEIVTARYAYVNEYGNVKIRSLIGLYNLNSSNELEVTIIDNIDGSSQYATYWKELSEELSPTSKVGDIVYKTVDGKFKAIDPSEWNIGLGTAVGVCVIPTSHDVYGTGECAIISLKQIGPEEWGGLDTDIEALENIKEQPYTTDTIAQGTIETSLNCYLPSDKFNAVANPLDEGTAWSDKVKNSLYCPSPYDVDGLRNTLVNVGGLNDFDGYGNTEKIINALGDENEGNYAAKAVTTITSGGLDWYLPACGELAYIIPRFNKINAALARVSGSTPLNNDMPYWSSSEFSHIFAWYIYPSNGFVAANYKNIWDQVYARPFARVTLNS